MIVFYTIFSDGGFVARDNHLNAYEIYLKCVEFYDVWRVEIKFFPEHKKIQKKEHNFTFLSIFRMI